MTTPAGRREPSTAELADDMAELKVMLADVNSKLDNLPYIRRDVYEARHTSLRSEIALQLAAIENSMKTLSTRVGNVEDRHTWIARTAMAGLLLPVVAALVVAALLAGGGS